ncbi:MAG TPA: DUF2268 domain-containing putative Zn-dependent protease [Burkholderiaceae bacterium]
MGIARRLGMLAAALLAAASPQVAAAAPAPEIRTADVDRFYAVYDAAHGHPTAAALQHGYVDPGSAELRAFMADKVGTAADLARAIERRPQAFAKARDCMSALPAVRARLVAVDARYEALVPGARLPPVTLVVGRLASGGTTTAGGVVVALETVCAMDWTHPDPADRLVHLIAHEDGHVQQPAALVDPPPGASLLFQSLVEGEAELLAELTSGDILNTNLKSWTRGHECDIERAFARDAPGADTSRWLYNGHGTPARPGDLGYWVGYRIAKAYCDRAPDKHRAIAELLAVTPGNAAELLERSGWTPDTDCAKAAADDRARPAGR